MKDTTIPSTGFLGLSQVLKLIPIGKTTWWNGVKSGKYPKSVKLSERVTAWRASDIHALIESHQSPTNNHTTEAQPNSGGDK